MDLCNTASKIRLNIYLGHWLLRMIKYGSLLRGGEVKWSYRKWRYLSTLSVAKIRCMGCMASVTEEWNMDVVQRWNNTERESSKYSEKNLFLCSFVHHTYHLAWRGLEPRSPACGAGGKYVEKNTWTWEWVTGCCGELHMDLLCNLYRSNKYSYVGKMKDRQPMMKTWWGQT